MKLGQSALCKERTRGESYGQRNSQGKRGRGETVQNLGRIREYGNGRGRGMKRGRGGDGGRGTEEEKDLVAGKIPGR